MNPDIIEHLLSEIIAFALKLGMGLIVLAVGFFAVNRIKSFLSKRMIKKEVDPTIREFLIPALSLVLNILVVITAIGTAGIKVTSFAAIMAGLAAGVGLSLQGSLSNFAGGLLIIAFKPFKVGDYIEALNNSGTVESISILYTTIVSDENQVIVLPNSSLLNDPIKNYSIKPTRRLDIEVSLSYDEDIDKAIDILRNMLKNEPNVLKKEPITVEVMELMDTKIKLAVNAFTKKEDYWKTYFKLYRQTKTVLNENGISIHAAPTEMIVTQKD